MSLISTSTPWRISRAGQFRNIGGQQKATKFGSHYCVTTGAHINYTHTHTHRFQGPEKD